MSGHNNDSSGDELFFDMLKDEFIFFYALTISLMDLMKKDSLEEEQS